MPVATLALAGTVSMMTGLAYAYVARVVAQRDTSRDTRAASLSLALWWGMLGAYLLVQGALTIVASFGALTSDAYFASRILAIPLLCGGVAALVHHLTYLYTGNRKLSNALALVYVPIALLFAYATWTAPHQLTVSSWIVELDDSSPAYKLTYLLVGLPPIVASIAYYALLRRIQDPVRRYRVRLVSLTIAAYIGSGLVARLGASDLFKFVTLVGFGLAAAIMVLLAYRPPRVVLARLQGGSPQ